MKTPEDEAFDDLAKRQGAWGGGYQAKRKAAADKSQEPAQEPVAWADLQKKAQQIVESKFLWKRFIDGTPLANDIACWMADFARQYTTPPQPVQEALYGMNQDDWKEIVAAIAKVRDGRGIYLACRPADVFQDWFLALGTAKVKEKNNG